MIKPVQTKVRKAAAVKATRTVCPVSSGASTVSCRHRTMSYRSTRVRGIGNAPERERHRRRKRRSTREPWRPRRPVRARRRARRPRELGRPPRGSASRGKLAMKLRERSTTSGRRASRSADFPSASGEDEALEPRLSCPSCLAVSGSSLSLCRSQEAAEIWRRDCVATGSVRYNDERIQRRRRAEAKMRRGNKAGTGRSVADAREGVQ